MSARAPRGVDPSPSETHKVNVISPRSKVTGAKYYAHVHLSLMCSPQAQSGHTGINTMDIAEFTRIPRSRSSNQGQRSPDQKPVPMHIYHSSVVHRHRLATLVSIPWAQQHSQDCQGQGHRSMVKGHRTKISMPMHIYPTWVVPTPNLGKVT